MKNDPLYAAEVRRKAREAYYLNKKGYKGLFLYQLNIWRPPRKSGLTSKTIEALEKLHSV